MNKLVKISAAVISSVAFVGMAQAATPGAYAGIGLGYSQLETSTSNLSVDGATVHNSSDRGGLGGRLFGGYNFNKYFGLEGAYTTYATSKRTYTEAGVAGSDVVKNSLSALSIVGKGYLPINNTGFNVYALGGVAEVFSKARDNQNVDTVSSPASQSDSTRALRPTFGVGASYDINQNLTTSLEASRIEGRGNTKTSSSAIPNADLISLNLGYNFG